jgi:superfamily II DNA/RNA helicase
VFNFDVPTHPEDYVHRIGRTGRAGRLGKAYTLAVPSDDKYITQIESLVKQAIPRGVVPEGVDLASEGSDRPQSDRGPKSGRESGRDRGRSSGRDRRDDSRPRREKKEPAVIEAVAVAEEVEAPRPVRDERVREDRPREERQAERNTNDRREDRPRSEDRRDRSRDERPREDRPRDERPRDDRPRDDRRYGRDDRRDTPVVGMGDHVPDFILRSFKLPEAKVEELEDDSILNAAEA